MTVRKVPETKNLFKTTVSFSSHAFCQNCVFSSANVVSLLSHLKTEELNT